MKPTGEFKAAVDTNGCSRVMSGEVELVADRWWRRLRCRTELEVNATGELKTAVDADGPSGGVSVEVEALLVAQAVLKY